MTLPVQNLPAMISPHFSWYEVTHSETAEREGIDNDIPQDLEWVASKTAIFMERIRLLLRFPIKVNSWYRGPALQALPAFYNPTSQHPKAEAVDFVCPQFGSPVDICRKIIATTEIQFDQLILEHSWVHVSQASAPGSTQRMQVLSLLRNKKYAGGLTDVEGNPL
jgi:hypothetical protein